MPYFVDRLEPNGDRSTVPASPFPTRKDAEAHVARRTAAENRVDDERQASFAVYER